MRSVLLAFIPLIVLLSTSCFRSGNDKKFSVISPENSGIQFSNDIQANDTFNVIDFYYIYNGGGVGIGDFNNDGLQDIYFSGNQVSNKMYLNQGNFHFKDISKVAGVEAADIWSQGIAVVDINNDGWTDLYVCASIYPDSISRVNKLFINKGLNSDGIPTFSEEAAQWGIADHGHSANASFFDFDLDGDLDLFIINNFMDTKFPSEFRPKVVDGSSVNSDKLYRNNGNGTFTDISVSAGILVEGYSHGIAIRDLNLDGWPDVYITNDFLPNDILYINNQDGTFTNKVSDYLKHQCFSAMGNDIADINNDGLQDIFALDMLPEMNYRKKTMLLKSTPMNQINYEKFDYDYQFIRNMLHLNMGPDEKGDMHYAEIGLEAGVFETDWSWSPLLADFDNDGNKDLFIANGFPGDVTDMDFAHYMNKYQRLVSSRSDLFDSIPEVLIANYIFKNNGDLTFTKMTNEWGLDAKTFSNGAAYADFDNDGDLDLVTNNINQKATLYKNNTTVAHTAGEKTNFLHITLEGSKNNLHALGSKVLLFAGGQMQFIENSPTHGFMSSMDGVIHFGIGANTRVDSLVVLWPGGGKSVMRDIPANQNLTVKYDNDTNFSSIAPYLLTHQDNAFKRLQGDKKIEFLHKEKELFDFNLQYTVPHKLSQYTPGMAVSDINGDGLEDIYIGGNKLSPGVFMIQTTEGKFLAENRILSRDTLGASDMGLLFFDADNDGDNDLYIVSGGIEWAVGAASYKDRLYLNDGKGYFNYKEDALPDLRNSGSCVKACDFDKDGDLDLFVGTRSKPWAYPMSESSTILINEGGIFRDNTQTICPGLTENMMVTDAIWTDFDNDSWTDLIIVGEWMGITFLKNNQGSFTDVSGERLKEPSAGWWNCIAGTDIDNDGDIDYVCGNLGLNSIFKGDPQYPLSIYASDFDRNGMVDPIVVRFNSDENFDKKPFPIHTRDAMLQQVQFLFQRVKTYSAFGKSTIYDLFTPEELENAYHLEGTYFKSACLINNDDGTFRLLPLSNEVQIAPVFGILPQDFNADGNTDLLLIGNDYSIELMTGRIDASPGLYLSGKGNGKFTVHKPYQSGFRVTGDAKGIVALFDNDGQELILTTQNKDSLVTHLWTSDDKLASIDPGTALWGDLLMTDGSKRKQEFYYGSTYLSQSSRRLIISKNCNKVLLHFANGDLKEIDL